MLASLEYASFVFPNTAYPLNTEKEKLYLRKHRHMRCDDLCDLKSELTQCIIFFNFTENESM